MQQLLILHFLFKTCSSNIGTKIEVLPAITAQIVFALSSNVSPRNMQKETAWRYRRYMNQSAAFHSSTQEQQYCLCKGLKLYKRRFFVLLINIVFPPISHYPQKNMNAVLISLKILDCFFGWTNLWAYICNTTGLASSLELWAFSVNFIFLGNVEAIDLIPQPDRSSIFIQYSVFPFCFCFSD